MTNRRDFLQRGTWMLASGAALVGPATGQASSSAADARSNRTPVAALGHRELKLGVIGCNQRGTRVVLDALATADVTLAANPAAPVRLTAMADRSSASVQQAFRAINGQRGDQVDLGRRRFSGPDAARQLLETDVDAVLITFSAADSVSRIGDAIAARKHVFLEKPLVRTPDAIEELIRASEMADAAGLSVAVGYQRRHDRRIIDCVNRLRHGLIGDLESAQFGRPADALTDPKYWDDVDLVRWCWSDRECDGIGGLGPIVGDLGADVAANRPAMSSGVRLVGTGGTCDPLRGIARDRAGRILYHCDVPNIRGRAWQQQQIDFIDALRQGFAINQLPDAIATAAAVQFADARASSRSSTSA